MPLTRRTAAPWPGPATVSAPTVESYCSRQPGGEARFGEPSSASSTAPGSMPRSGSRSLGSIGRAGRRRGASVLGRAARPARGRWRRWSGAAGSGDLGASSGRPRCPPSTIVMSPSSVTRPMTAHGQAPAPADLEDVVPALRPDDRAASAPATREIMTSNGSMSGSRRGIASRSTRMPGPGSIGGLRRGARDAAGAQVLEPLDEPALDELEAASMSSFSANGSPTWTVGRLDGSSSPNVALASTDAPPMPSRPVVEPNSTTRLPGPGAAARVRQRSSSRPMAITLTSGLPGVDRIERPARRRPSARPRSCRSRRRRARRPRPGAGCARRPGRRTGARRAPRSGRAPIVKMSRRMPPTPVAAPWYGSTARRVVVRLELERDREPVPDRDHAGVLARSGDDALARRRQRREQRLRALVRAVLAPHDAEHRELEVVRVAAAEPVADGVELLVGQPSRAMERLHGPSARRSARSSRRPRRRALRPRRARRGALDQRADDRQPVVRAEDRLRGALRVGHQPGDVAAPRSRRRRSPAASRSGWPVVVLAAGCRPRRRTGTAPARRARARRASRRRRSSSPRRGRSASAAAGRRAERRA